MSTLSTCACGLTPTRYWTWRHSHRATASGSARPARICSASARRLGVLLDWAERQLEPISAYHQQAASNLIPGYDVAQVSGILFTVVQRVISDQLRMTKPELAGAGLGLELWRLLIREHEAPEQPVVQREFQKRWAYPKRCKDAAELRRRLPQWEVWGRELEVMKGRELEEDFRVCSLDQLLPEDFRRALDDKLELQSYSERLLFVKRRLGLEKHRALAQETNADAPVSMEVGALESEPLPVDPDHSQLEAAFALLQRAFRPGKGRGKGGKPSVSDLPASAGDPKGKGKGKGPFTGRCWKCDQPGHRAADCPTNRGKGLMQNLDESRPTQGPPVSNREPGLDDGWDFAMGLREVAPKLKELDTACTACTVGPASAACACVPASAACTLGRKSAKALAPRWAPTLSACIPSRVRFAVPGGVPAPYFGSRFRPLNPEDEDGGSVNLLAEADEQPELMPLQEGRPFKPEYVGYTKVQVAIDAGAAASVMPEWLLRGHTALPSEGSKKGVQYLAADGGRIPNLGEVHLGFLTKEQHRCRITFQVANVKRPLLAVGTLTKAGNDLHFTASGGQIVNRRTKRIINFTKVDGIYVLELLMGPGPAGAGADGWQVVQGKRTSPASAARLAPKASPGRGFTRPGP